MNNKQRICMGVFLVLVVMTFLNYLLKVVTGIWAHGEPENPSNFYIYFLDFFGEIGFWGIITFVLMKFFKDKKE